MKFLQTILAFFKRTRRPQRTRQSIPDTQLPQQAAPSTNMFHRVGMVMIIGGNFTTIVIGKSTTCCLLCAPGDKRQPVPSINTGTQGPTHEGGSTAEDEGTRRATT